MNPGTRQYLAIAQEEHGYDPSLRTRTPCMASLLWFTPPPKPPRVVSNQKISHAFCRECNRETAFDLVYVPRTRLHLRQCQFCDTHAAATVH